MLLLFRFLLQYCQFIGHRHYHTLVSHFESFVPALREAEIVYVWNFGLCGVLFRKIHYIPSLAFFSGSHELHHLLLQLRHHWLSASFALPDLLQAIPASYIFHVYAVLCWFGFDERVDWVLVVWRNKLISDFVYNFLLKLDRVRSIFLLLSFEFARLLHVTLTVGLLLLLTVDELFFEC